MGDILKVEGLTKSFGKIKAVSNLSFSVSEGQVVGVLGPNGSGKTTTLGMVLGIKFPDRGRFQWFDGKKGKSVNQHIGSLLEVPYFFPYLNLEKNLKIVALTRGMGIHDVGRVLDLVGLSNRAKTAYYTLSHGMKQRLALASALLGDPEVLVLDEPTNGLDPEGIAEVRSLIKKQSQRGKTIIMASHILDEVEKVCTDVVILKNSEKIAHGKVNELLTDKVLTSVSADNMATLEKCLKSRPEISIKEINRDNILFTLDEGLTTSELNRWLIEQGIVVSTLELHKKSLESQFLELVKDPSIIKK